MLCISIIELLFGKLITRHLMKLQRPDVSYFRVFGCGAYVFLPEEVRQNGLALLLSRHYSMRISILDVLTCNVLTLLTSDHQLMIVIITLLWEMTLMMTMISMMIFLISHNIEMLHIAIMI
jgi:hypothetical protein